MMFQGTFGWAAFGIWMFGAAYYAVRGFRRRNRRIELFPSCVFFASGLCVLAELLWRVELLKKVWFPLPVLGLLYLFLDRKYLLGQLKEKMR